MSSINNDVKQIKTGSLSSTGNLGGKNTDPVQDDKVASGNVSKLSDLQNLKSGLRAGSQDTQNNISSLESQKQSNVNQASTASNNAAESSISASSRVNEAETLTSQAGVYKADAKTKIDQAKSRGPEEAEILKNEAKALVEQAKQSMYEAKTKQNEAEYFNELAQKYNLDSENFTAQAGNAQETIQSQKATLNKQSVDLNEVEDKISAKEAESSSDSPKAKKAGASDDSDSSSDAGSGGFGADSNPYVSSAESVRAALWAVVKQGVKASVTPEVQRANKMTQKTLAQLGKSIVEAGIATVISTASSASFRLRILDGVFSAMTSNAEEGTRYHEERRKSNTELVKKTDDMIKPV